MLRGQMQAYVGLRTIPTCAPPCGVGYGRLVEFAEQASGAPKEQITGFFGVGMLMNVIASMGLLDEPEPWASAAARGLRQVSSAAPFF